MSDERDTGGPAYPHPVAIGPLGDVYSPHDVCAPGMSLRDWFAGQALAGIVSTAISEEMMTVFTTAAKARGMEEEPWVAAMSYALADAMLAERSKS